MPTLPNHLKPANRWKWVNETTASENLSLAEARVLQHLAWYWDQRINACSHSLTRISRETRLTRQGVLNALVALDFCGLVEIKGRSRGSGHLCSHRAVLFDDPGESETYSKAA